MSKIIIQRRVQVLCFLLAVMLCFSHNHMMILHAADTAKEKQNLEKDLSDLNKNKDSVDKELSTATASLKSTLNEIESLQMELGIAKARETSQYELMKKRIKYMYEAGPTDVLTAFFSAESFSDFINEASFIISINDYDREMLKKYETMHLEVREKEKSLLTKQSELETKQKELTGMYNELNSKIQSTSNALSEVEKQIAEEEAKKAAEQLQASQEAVPAPSPSVDHPVEQTKPSAPSDIGDVTLFAGILQCEAGSSNYDALLAVATVIMNRVESPRYPDTLTGVIFQSGQFSPTWNGRLDKVLAKGPAPLCYKVAKDALAGARYAPVSHCYFFNHSASGVTGIQVGGNIFY